VDAYRVAGGVKEEARGAVDTLYEMIFIKAVELFTEAIPGVIIQLLAILTADEAVSMAAWLSLGASALSAEFISATISYDFDTNPTKRKESPGFYGYIPASAKKRTVVFMSIFMLYSILLLVRCLTKVLLGLSGGKVRIDKE